MIKSHLITLNVIVFRGGKTECFSFFKNTFSMASSMASLRDAPPCGQNPENKQDGLNTRTVHE
jgi:hypothetical protein